MEKISNINKKHYIFWGCVIIASLFFVNYISVAIKPFVLGFVFAYLFLPIVNKLEERRISRSYSSGAIVIFAFIILALTFIMLVPFLCDRVIFFAQDIMQNYGSENTLVRKLSKIFHTDVNVIWRVYRYLTDYIASASNTIHFIRSPNAMIASMINIIATIFVMPIITFYMLKDWNKIRDNFYKLLPKKHCITVQNMLCDIDKSIFSYLRGQVRVCGFFVLFYAFLLQIVGLNFGFLLGIMVGVMIFIPYVGFLIGFLISMMVAGMQFGFDYQFFIVVLIFIIGQFIDANYTTPKFVGEKVGLHPIWIVFGLFVFAKLFGVTGAIIALPLTTSAAVFVRFAIMKYKSSNYYALYD